jgi:hypothetical protein
MTTGGNQWYSGMKLHIGVDSRVVTVSFDTLFLFDMLAVLLFVAKFGTLFVRTILGQIGRGQVHRDALVVRKLESGVLDGAAHPLAGLLDLYIGQTDHCEAGQAVGQVDFHRDFRRIQATQRPTLHQRQAHFMLSQIGAHWDDSALNQCALDVYAVYMYS